MTNHFADFPADDFDTAPAAKTVTARQTFPCTACAGTGNWVSPRGAKSGKCFVCKGSGKFLTDPRTRAKNRAASLIEQVNQRGTLSDNQVAAAERMIAKTETTRAANQAAREVNKVEVDLAPIRVMFEAAVRSGHKRPVYRAEGLVISRAPDSGKNPGALYVKDTGSTYGGKVVEATYSPNYDGNRADFAHYSYDVKNETGKVVETVTVRQSATEALNKIAADPREASATWGRRTGSCSCCGRELTKTASIEAGIGPICAEKWSL